MIEDRFASIFAICGLVYSIKRQLRPKTSVIRSFWRAWSIPLVLLACGAAPAISTWFFGEVLAGHLYYSVRPVPPSPTMPVSSVVSTTTVTSLTSKYFGYGDLLIRHAHQVGVIVLTGPNSRDLADKDVPSNQSSRSGKDRCSSISLWPLIRPH